MFRKLITLLLVVLVINLGGVRLAYADSKEEKQARFPEGYITDAGAETFAVTNRKGVATTVAYPQ